MAKNKGKKKGRKNSKNIVDEYAHIQIDKRQRMFVRAYFVMLCAVFCALIFYQMRHGLNWSVNVPTIIIAGLTTLIVQSSENWVYKPWQKTAQRVETTKVHKVYKF